VNSIQASPSQISYCWPPPPWIPRLIPLTVTIKDVRNASGKYGRVYDESKFTYRKGARHHGTHSHSTRRSAKSSSGFPAQALLAHLLFGLGWRYLGPWLHAAVLGARGAPPACIIDRALGTPSSFSLDIGTIRPLREVVP